jgi:hypothetical protein
VEEVIIRVSADGETVEFEVNGVVGPACTELTKALEASMGEVKKRALKPEHRMAVAVPRAVGRK